MPPKNASAAELGYDDEPKLSKSFDSSSNKDLMEDAGVIKMDDPMSWGKGIVNDFKRTVGTHWVEGMTNFNQKTIAVTLLMFISVIAPTLTFGAVYGKVTDNRIGTVETILATCWVGVVYSLIGGMPLVSTQDISGLFLCLDVALQALTLICFVHCLFLAVCHRFYWTDPGLHTSTGQHLR